MAQCGFWNTHPDVSPFVPLAAAQLSLHRMGFAGLQHSAASGGAAPIRQPDSMQVDSTAPRASAASSTEAAAAPRAGASAGSSSEAGAASGVPTCGGGAAAEAAVRRPPRKHSDAPVRKLSVSLIDTYKLINQVCSSARERARSGRAPSSPSSRFPCLRERVISAGG
jgi:hypothetical protein